MIETLFCQFDGHKWQRERKRGVKPRFCDAHKPAKPESNSGEGNGQENNSEGAGSLTAPSSVVSDEALELLTSGAYLDPEFQRKLEYTVTQLERGRVDDDDVKLLKQTRDRLLQQHARTVSR